MTNWRYNFGVGVGVSSDWTPGSSYESVHPAAGVKIAAGENLEVSPPRRLVQSFNALWSDDVKGEGTSRVTWEIEPVADSDHARLAALRGSRGLVLGLAVPVRLMWLMTT